MSKLVINSSDGRIAFEPGETITLDVEWDMSSEPESLEVRLVWNTSGKGTTDFGVEKTIPLEAPGQTGSRSLELQLPEAPYSFSGKLVSLLWAIELIANPHGDSSRTEIIIAPGARELLLHRATADEPDDS